VVICVLAFEAAAQSKPAADSSKMHSYHSDKGFVLTTPDNKHELRLGGRLQFRMAFPQDQDPMSFEDFQKDDILILKVNRARFKMGGHTFHPWFKYALEYDVAFGNLLDFRVMIERWPWLSFKIGQFKADYNLERVISSGEQQMVERSLINHAFTVDRQQGISIYGHVKGSGVANFNYWVNVLNGTGRGSRTNDDMGLMYLGRLQWNFLGRTIRKSGGDPTISPLPVGSIAVAAATNTSPYTRFSTAGGGQLPTFEKGAPGQYHTDQIVFESAFKYRGFSWQHETHLKTIEDRVNHVTTHLRGYFLQAGIFPHEVVKWIPANLEWAFRYVDYRPNTRLKTDRQRSYATVFNYYLREHKNKLSAEASYLRFQSPAFDDAEGFRFRLQWEVSF
jgi:hypothetical protein